MTPAENWKRFQAAKCGKWQNKQNKQWKSLGISSMFIESKNDMGVLKHPGPASFIKNSDCESISVQYEPQVSGGEVKGCRWSSGRPKRYPVAALLT